MAPDGKKILNALSPEYSLDDHLTTHEMRDNNFTTHEMRDDHLTTHEMRVFEYLQRYVSTLNVELSKVFLKYDTGMDVSSNEISIKVLFNGEVGLENMTPRNNTCSSSYRDISWATTQ